MKKKIIPGLIAAGVLALALLIISVAYLIQKYSPSKEHMALKDYYKLSANDEAAIILDNDILDTRAKVIDGHVYLDHGFVSEQLNSRFYWDSNENILLYTTATDVISANANDSQYQVTKAAKDWERPIVKASEDSAWIDIDFVKNFTKMDYRYKKKPNRVVLTTKYGDITVKKAKKDTALRYKGGIKSRILKDLKADEELVLLEELENWNKVASKDGITGYVRSKYLSDPEKKTLTSDFKEETFSHIKKDHTICMAWHQVTDPTANSQISSILANTKGINVISPTWFYLNDNDGNLADLASRDYVKYCQKNHIEVWALFSNLENPDADTTKVLTHTSRRQNLVNQIVSMAIQYNLDGVNLDFEAIKTEAGESYVQLIRELSIKLRNNGIVFSVDNYVPTDYTAFYNRREQANFADYVVTMGYDQHTTTSEEAGSVAALDWVTEGVDNTLKEVPAEQTILAMPFYTRIWTLTPDKSKESEGSTEYKFSAKAYGMSAAWSIVQDHGVKPKWDNTSGQYYAEYTKGDDIVKVWLENDKSMEQRLKLMKDRKLAGAAFWKLGFETGNIWDTVVKYID